MAVEYVLANKKDKSIGVIGLSVSVFESIAKYSIEDMNDVSLMLSTSFRKSVSCKVVNNQLVLTMNILVKIGKNVNDICNDIQQHVQNMIKEMTNINNVKVNINIRGFYI